MEKIEAFVFDMDGILLDTETICEKTWIKAGKEFGIQDEKAMELFKKCIGTNKNDTFNILKTSLGADFALFIPFGLSSTATHFLGGRFKLLQASLYISGQNRAR